jgi:hypothetical protein
MSSPLIEAVQAFDAELDRFAKAAGAACRRPLDSKRDLEKAASAIAEAAAVEAGLQERAQALLAALQAAQGEQQTRAEALRVRAQEIRERISVYETLALRYQQLGGEGSVLAEAAQKLNVTTRASEGAASAELLVGLDELEKRVSEVRATARSLAEDSRAAHFDDVADEAHAVEQTLSALRNKLLIARRAAAANPPPSDA